MNKKFIAIIALVFAVVLTGYSVSGTYARYTKKLTSYSDEAVVAKWKIDFDSATKANVDLFKSSYLAADKTNSETSVATLGGKKVIAPGTSGEYKFAFEGTLETNYTLAVSGVTVTDTTGQLKFALVEDGSEGPESWVNASALQTALQNIGSGKVYAANSVPKGYTIKWKWEIDDKAEGATDTPLGEAADGTTVAAKVGFTVTVTQSENKATA